MRLPVTLLSSDEPRNELMVLDHRVGPNHWKVAVRKLDRRDAAEIERLLAEGRRDEVLTRLEEVHAQGVLVGGVAEDDRWKIELHALGREQSYAVLLAVRGTHSWIDSREPACLGVGDHLLVPVFEAGEQAVSDLVAALGGLPRDFKTLLLETLRDPGLEERVERLERASDRSRSGRPPVSGGWGRRARTGARNWFSQPLTTGLFLALLLPVLLWLALGALAGAGLFDGQTGEGVPHGEPEPESDLGTTQANGDRREDLDLPSSSPREAVGALREALRGTRDPRIVGLHTAHFSRAARADGALSPEEDLAWAILKVKLLELGAPLDDRALGERFLFTDSKQLLRDRLDRLDGEERAALAFVACKAWGEAALLKGSGDALHLGGTCQDLEEPRRQEEAAAGLDRLAEFVRSLDPGGGGSAEGDGGFSRQAVLP